MDKTEAKKLGAWVSLLAGLCFLAGSIAVVYVMFFMPPETGVRFLAFFGRLLRPSGL